MTQLKELFYLKALISERKLKEKSSFSIAVELWCFVSLLISIPFAVLAYVFVTWSGNTYLFEMIGIAYAVYLFGWVLGPLAGSRMSEFLDFSALVHLPIGRVKLFLASISTSLIDPIILPAYPVIWGISVGLAILYGWAWLPLILVANLSFLMTCLASSQVVLLLYHLVLRRTRWFPFVISFLTPLAIFLGIVYTYSSVLVSLPLFDTFTQPDFPFLESTCLLPSSAFLLFLKSFLTWDLGNGVLYLGLYAGQLTLILLLGTWLVQRVQKGEIHKDLEKAGGRWFYEVFRVSLIRILRIPSTLSTLILKDFRLLLREPHTKIIALLPLLSAALFFGILYVLSTVIAELRIMDGVVISSELIEFLKPFPFQPNEILYSWPVFLCFALFVIASDLSSNLFGIERQGIQQLMLVPVSSWQIILSKNLSILGFVCIPILLIYGFAFFSSLHSMHTFHAIWMYFVLGLFFLFIAGNFISIFFPMRIDSSVSGSLQRDSFARTLGMALSRFVLFAVMGLITLPILYECIRPLWGMPGYFSPYSSQAEAIIAGVLGRLISIWPEHGLYSLYALGAYCAALFWLSLKFDQRREVLLSEMGRMES